MEVIAYIALIAGIIALALTCYSLGVINTTIRYQERDISKLEEKFKRNDVQFKDTIAKFTQNRNQIQSSNDATG